MRLAAILKSTGFVSRREGKFIFVGTPEDFTDHGAAVDRVGTRVYRPNYVTAEELQTLITPLLTEKIGVVSVTSEAKTGIPSNDQRRRRRQPSPAARSWWSATTRPCWPQIDQLVAEVDVRPMQVPIEAMILSVQLDDKDKFGVNFQLLRAERQPQASAGEPCPQSFGQRSRSTAG